jgi:hypothetical protein
MALGKPITDFTLKITSLTFTEGLGESLDVQGNLEGTATGFGSVLGTAAFTNAGEKSGTWKFCGVAYLENGDSIRGVAQGTHESSGVHRWRTRGVEKLSDGRTVALEGEIDLATRSWTGKLFEWS